MTSDVSILSRRAVLGAAAALIAWPARAAIPAGGRLRFVVLRNGSRLGEHDMIFTTPAPGAVTVETSVSLAVRLGPVPVFRYTHHATEIWRDGAFASLESRTSSNGKLERVQAQHTASGVTIETLGGALQAPADAAPLTHWNAEVFRRPLFNPQTGRLLRLAATRRLGDSPPGASSGAATHWILRGDAQIDDWYDQAGAWIALSGRLNDRSVMNYQRV